MTRLPQVKPEDLSNLQKRLHDAIVSGPRGKFGGPFPALLHCPEIADRVQALGGTLRFEGKLSATLREVAILAVARHWRCAVEWDAHVVIAEREGVDPAVIRAIRNGETPRNTTPDILAVIAVCRALNDTQFVSDPTYRQAIGALGEDGVVELTVLIGYFGLLAMVLNTFEVAPDPIDGEPPDDLKLPERR